MIAREFQNDLERMRTASAEELSAIEGVGEVIAGTFCEYFQNQENNQNLDKLLKELTIQNEVMEEEQNLAGLSFVVTGSLNHFDNRKELQDLIEKRGGKVTGSVTGKTTALINNDSTSNSSKNKKAKELDVQILTEDEFMNTFFV